MSDNRPDPIFSQEAQKIVPGIYEHYKGKRYRVFTLVHHSETLEEMVVYQSLYGNQLMWVRPVTIFCSRITVDGEDQPRFRLIETD